MTLAATRRWWVLALLFGMTVTGQDLPATDQNLHVLYFENLAYPVAAKMTKVQGTVVLRLEVNELGRVSAVAAISGPKILVPECLANAKKWFFVPASPRSVVLVYRFEIRGLCQLPCASQFSFNPPDFVMITSGEPVVDHSGRN